MQPLVRAICQKEGLKGEEIKGLGGGQVNQVFRINGAHILRIGQREDAFERLQRETALLQRLAGKIPVASVRAFGELEGHVYQIQEFIPGQMLYAVWKEMTPAGQESIAAEFAAHLQVIHGLGASTFSNPRENEARLASWADDLVHKFRATLEEINTIGIRMAPGIVEMAAEYFEAHSQVLQGGPATTIHGDLTLANILVDRGKISALLDFEYAMQAPADYELWTLEAFCLYPNDWAEEGNESFCTADFASLIPLLRKHYPALFEIPNLRERVDLYQIDGALGSFLAWRKANLATIPPERMNGQDFYMARITNFLFGHGARMF